MNLKMVYSNLGLTFNAIGNPQQALNCFNAGLRMTDLDPELDRQLMHNKLLTYDYLPELPIDADDDYLIRTILSSFEGNAKTDLIDPCQQAR